MCSGKGRRTETVDIVRGGEQKTEKEEFPKSGIWRGGKFRFIVSYPTPRARSTGPTSYYGPSVL
jgi:hypothetical protein